MQLESPNWQETIARLPAETFEFFERSHQIWFLCLPQVRSTTITSLMYFFIWDELDLTFKHAISASYFSSVRALRYVFEFATQAAVLEQNYAALPDDQAKFNQAWNDDDFKGFSIFQLDRLNLISKSEVTVLKDLYGKLSQSGSHAAGKFIKLLYDDPSAVALHSFDQNLFRLCNELCLGVVDWLLVVLMSKYPVLKSDANLKATVSRLGLSMALARML